MKNFGKTVFIVVMVLFIVLAISTNSKAATVKITGEVVNIRKEASTNASIVARLSENVECEYIGEKGNWYQIKYKNYTGYVSKDYAKLQGTVSNNQGNSNTTNTPNSNTQTNQQANNQNNNSQTSNTNIQPTQTTKKLKQNTTIKILPLVHSSNIGDAKKGDIVSALTETSGWSYIQTEEISRMG